jgi:class 3 adenylate cyclase
MRDQDDQPDAREGQAGRTGVAERPVVSMKLGNTLERLKALYREPLDPRIAEHHGRIVKTTGDGVLVEFASVVDAVRCAVAAQQAMAERNTAVEADNRIELRIGINLGDVIVEGDDLYGDGVNIAARIEALADAGSHVTHRWRRQSRANPSLKPNSLLAGSLQ